MILAVACIKEGLWFGIQYLKNDWNLIKFIFNYKVSRQNQNQKVDKRQNQKQLIYFQSRFFRESLTLNSFPESTVEMSPNSSRTLLTLLYQRVLCMVLMVLGRTQSLLPSKPWRKMDHFSLLSMKTRCLLKTENLPMLEFIMRFHQLNSVMISMV